MVIGAEGSLLGPCCCIGCFVKSPEGFFIHMVIGAEGVLVGCLLLHWVLCEVTKKDFLKSYGHWGKRCPCWVPAAVLGAL